MRKSMTATELHQLRQTTRSGQKRRENEFVSFRSMPMPKAKRALRPLAGQLELFSEPVTEPKEN
jgi:hypothetical protein